MDLRLIPFWPRPSARSSLERSRPKIEKSRQIKVLERILIAKACQLLRKFARAGRKKKAPAAGPGLVEPFSYRNPTGR
jgi:hypothetical protein